MIWSRGWLTTVWEDPLQGSSVDADTTFVITASHTRKQSLNPLTPNDPYWGSYRTADL